jgi:hypothetical protein
MAGWTNRGKYLIESTYFRAAAAPANFYLALVTVAVAPGPDTNILSDLTEIVAGNGYDAGGKSVARNATDFDVLTEDDSADRAFIQIKDESWTAAGGTLPASGAGARYAVLLDDNATPANRQVLAYWDLGSAIILAATQMLTLQDCELRLNES